MRPRTMRSVWLAAVAAAALLTGGLAPAGAKEKLNSFAGSCSMQGTVHFSPPATNDQQLLAVSYDPTGTCSGRLNGRDIHNAPITAHQSGHSDGSCMHADTTAPGRGTIRFRDGTTIPYTFEFHFVLTEGTFTFHGQRSGSGSGHGTFLTQRTPPDITAKCAGDGVSDAPMDMTLDTDSPLVSKRSSGNRQGASNRARALRLAVSPHTARTGRRSRFAFRVRTRSRRPVRGAVVRFAGHRARTNRRGRARIVVRLHRTGRRTARASKRGFRAGRAKIRVRRR